MPMSTRHAISLDAARADWTYHGQPMLFRSSSREERVRVIVKYFAQFCTPEGDGNPALAICMTCISGRGERVSHCAEEASGRREVVIGCMYLH
jgi:hypothetical protein